jgi:hypothetical protein
MSGHKLIYGFLVDFAYDLSPEIVNRLSRLDAKPAGLSPEVDSVGIEMVEGFNNNYVGLNVYVSAPSNATAFKAVIDILEELEEDLTSKVTAIALEVMLTKANKYATV